MPEASDTLVCPRILLSTHELSWESLPAFATALDIPFQYLAGPQERFVPASVKIGWNEDRLLVLATLHDADVFSDATGDDQNTWELGDVFEIFLRDRETEEYFELHTTPNAHRLQLRFPDAQAIINLRNGIGRLPDYKISGDMLVSLTRKTPGGWQVLSTVKWPQAAMGGRVALVSFSRYDYTRGQQDPVLSSTSLHQAVNYHRQEEWTPIIFEA